MDSTSAFLRILPIFILLTLVVGLVTAFPTAKRDARIVGGTEVNPKFKYPWIVSLRLKQKSGKWFPFCGGSLVAPGIVLSAGHCSGAGHFEPSEVFISVHRHNLTREATDESGLDVPVKKIVRHPKYHAIQSAIPEYDFALFFLDMSNVTMFPSDISFPALASNITDFANVDAITAGWGRIIDDGPDGMIVSPVLLEAKAKVWAQQECSKVVPAPYLIDAMVCAGGEEGHGVCHGDSGGPLFVAREGEQPVLYGIATNIPAVFGRVCMGADWVKEQIALEEVITNV